MVLEGKEWLQAMEAAKRLLPDATRLEQRSRATILLRLGSNGEFGKRKDVSKGRTSAVYLDWAGIEDYYRRTFVPVDGEAV